MCWACDATKGADGDLDLAFTNSEANWTRTLYASVPWTESPSYEHIPGFDLRMLHADLLHIWNMGLGRDICGSVISLLVRQRGFLRGRNIGERFRYASLLLQNFARRNRLNLSRKTLTANSICMRSKTFPEYRGSGYDTYIVMASSLFNPPCVWDWTNRSAL